MGRTAEESGVTAQVWLIIDLVSTQLKGIVFILIPV